MDRLYGSGWRAGASASPGWPSRFKQGANDHRRTRPGSPAHHLHESMTAKPHGRRYIRPEPCPYVHGDAGTSPRRRRMLRLSTIITYSNYSVMAAEESAKLKALKLAVKLIETQF